MLDDDHHSSPYTSFDHKRSKTFNEKDGDYFAVDVVKGRGLLENTKE